jgi:prolycopene isomerase
LPPHDNAFAGYSTAGTSTLTLMFVCAFAPWQRFESDAGHKAAYRAQKESLARELIRRVERRVFPNLSASIDVLEAASPLTNARFTGNPAGAIYGFEQSVGNSGLQRWPVRTPLRGLYLASAWSTPGGGYIGAQTAGLNAFTALSQDAQARS